MKMRQLFYGFLLLLGITLTYSCTEDGGLPGGGGGTELDFPPSMAVDVVDGSLLDGITIDAGNTFSIKISLTPGTAPLNILRVLEDSELVPAERIMLNGAPISGNPKLILGAEKEGIEYALTVTTAAAEKMSIYTFSVEDDNGAVVTTDIAVSTMTIDPTIINMGTDTYQVPSGSLVSLRVNATPGSAPLNFIVVGDENMTSIDSVPRLFYGDLDTPFDTNPYRIPEEDKNGFTKDIYIRAHDTPGALIYRIFVIDENEGGAFFDINIIVGEPTTDIWGVLFNAAGPEGTGGMDLDEGFGTGSMSSLAEIKDEGIDVNQPRAENWKRRISGVNGSEIRSLVLGMNGLSESYDFMNAYLREDLLSLFDAGIDFTFTNSDDELISPTVNQGDSFIVKNGENFYLIFIREINETLEDNDDNYVIDIKQ